MVVLYANFTAPAAREFTLLNAFLDGAFSTWPGVANNKSLQANIVPTSGRQGSYDLNLLQILVF